MKTIDFASGGGGAPALRARELLKRWQPDL